jgi:hypothetical protein
MELDLLIDYLKELLEDIKSTRNLDNDTIELN